MKDAVKIYFKDWLPDLPALDNPGLLEATNVLPVSGTYQSVPTITANSTTFGGVYYGNSDSGIYVFSSTTAASQTAYPTVQFRSTQTTGASTALTINNGLGGMFWGGFPDFYGKTSGSMYFAMEWGTTLKKVTGSEAAGWTASDVTGAASPSIVDSINEFLVTDVSYSQRKVRWSSLGDFDDWPTPLSSTAVARQAGEQEFSDSYGYIVDIIGGDEFGLVLQSKTASNSRHNSAVTRMQYVGGNIVFQFDRIAENLGLLYHHSGIKVGNNFYFAGAAGIFVSDGFNVRNIAYGRFAKYIRANADLEDDESTFTTTARCIRPVFDSIKNLIYWNFSTGFLVHNILEDRFSWITCTNYGTTGIGNIGTLGAMQSAYVVGQLSGTHGPATFTTGDFEPHVGGVSRIDGIATLVDQTTNAVSVQVASRMTLAETVSYNSATTANARSGFADFRKEGRYHRAKVTIAGTFNAAQGIEVRQVATGKT